MTDGMKVDFDLRSLSDGMLALLLPLSGPGWLAAALETEISRRRENLASLPLEVGFVDDMMGQYAEAARSAVLLAQQASAEPDDATALELAAAAILFREIARVLVEQGKILGAAAN